MLFGTPPGLPPPAIEALLLKPAVEYQRPRIESSGLVLTADRMAFDPATDQISLTGNVHATYEGTVVTSDEATLNQTTSEATFREGVTIEDEIGTMTAAEVYINYERPIRGYARDIVLHAYEAYFEGEELIIENGAYRLRNAWFTTCPGVYRVLLHDVVVRPGRFIHARRTGFEILGMTIPIPFFRVGLDPRETGLQAPVPSIDEDFRLGYRWINLFSLGERGSLLLEQIGGQGRVPYTSAQVAFDVSGEVAGDVLTVIRNEDRERFVHGYMDNVNVPAPVAEAAIIGTPKVALFAGRTTNITTRARLGEDLRLDRAWYTGVEASGFAGPLPFNAQVRYGSVREKPGEPTFLRAEAYGTVMSPALMVSRQVGLWLRVDAGAFEGGGASYGWVRPHLNLGFKPSEQFRIVASYFSAYEWGDALLDFDRLYSRRAAHLRFDLSLPSTDLSFLAKYDVDRRDWYDFEFRLTQATECFTPFVSYRKFPGTFAIGFSLRADRLFEALRRRELRRVGPEEDPERFWPTGR